MPPLTISKQTTHITEPLRQDGTPDYAAWLNRKYSAGVTPENNAATHLHLGLEPEALRQMGVDPVAPPEAVTFVGGLGNLGPFEEYLKKRLDAKGEVPGIGPLPANLQDAFATQQLHAHLAPWRHGDAPIMAAWLRANEANLARLEEVTRTRTRYWRPVPETLGFDTRFPSLLGFRNMGSALRLRALERIARGDTPAAVRDVVTGLRLAHLLEQGPSLIERLIAVAIRQKAAEPIGLLATSAPAARGAARELLEELKRVPASVPLDDVLDTNERLFLLAGYVDLYRAGRTSSRAWEERLAAIVTDQQQAAAALGQPPPSSAWKRIPPWAIDWDELLSTLNRCFPNPACAGELPAAQADLEPAALGRLLTDAHRDRQARRRIARAFLGLQDHGSLVRAKVSWNEAEAIRRAGLVAVAAAVFRSQHGRYPAEASALSALAGLDPGADSDGYAFTYQAPADGSRFAYRAAPQQANGTGVRGFCADSGGRLAFTPDGTLPTIMAGLCDSAAQTLVRSASGN